ncbi:phosphate transport system permease protein [uncultured Gammaproteobacteria bacterium]
MQLNLLIAILAVLSVTGYALGCRRAATVVDGRLRSLHSVPSYHGWRVALRTGLPAFTLFLVWAALESPLLLALALEGLTAFGEELVGQNQVLLRADLLNHIHNIVTGQASLPAVRAAADQFLANRELARWMVLVLATGLAGFGLMTGLSRISAQAKARNAVERVVTLFLIACSLVAILTTVGIVVSLAFEAVRFFAWVSPQEFLFGTHWSPQIATRADQVGSSGAFGAVPLFVGTGLIMVVAMVVAVPVGLMAAVYMSEYASQPLRTVVKPMLEILAGIPTVVYGFFAALTMAPFVRHLGHIAGLNVSSESALAAGLVMGVMIIPFVSSLSDDVINAVPQALRDGSYGLGATKSETIWLVVLPAALPGIVGAVMLAVSRAIGETMIVTMAAGLAAQGNLWDNFNPLNSVTTVTTQIATLLVGDQEFDSPKTLAAFGLGLVLFLVTLGLNFIALKVVRKYREKYD